MMERLLQNVRQGTRSFRRMPGFVVTTVLTLAVGIGIATAVFTVAEAVLLRSLPVRDQSSIVVLWGATSDGRVENFPLLLPDARDFAARAKSLQQIEFYGYGGATKVSVRNDGTVFHLRRALVSGGYFKLLGARPALGRTLEPSDDVVGAPPVIVLSHGAWQRYYAGDAHVVGRQIVMHATGVAHTVVGVMPNGLDYPQGTDFWAPVLPNSMPLGSAPIYAELNIVGRLLPGAAAGTAASELTAFFRRPEAPAWLHDVHGVAHPLADAVLGDVRPAVLAFAAAACLLLLVACINVANLQLVRGLARVREVAVRSALGAGRGRIIGQLLTESALLAVAGGVLGTLLAALAVRAFVAIAPAGTPRLEEIHLDAAAIAAALLLTVVVTLLSGLAPALVTSRVAVQDVLRSGMRHTGATRGFRRGTESIVIGQVALALLLLSGAGVIARSLVKLERVDLAFDPARLLVAELAVPYGGFGDTRAQSALLDRLLPRVEAVAGVRAVTPVLTPPFVSAGGIFGQIAAEGQSADEAAANPTLVFEVVTPSYFQTFDIPVLRGRALTDADREGMPRVAVLSASAARHYWPTVDPVGKRLRGEEGEQAITVVGVVPDTRYRDLRDARSTIYFPLRQSAFPVAPMTLVIRTDGRSASVVPSIRRAIAEADPGVAVASAAPLETLMNPTLAQPRLNVLLLATFATAALLLAGVGLFGVMATMVRSRTRELGVRMALGATTGAVARLVLRRGLMLGAVGAALGLIASLAANRFLTTMLYEVSPTDTITLALVAILLLAVSALASFLPARASTRIEPSVVLRSE